MRLKSVKMPVFPKLIYRFNSIIIKIPTGFFLRELYTVIPKDVSKNKQKQYLRQL